MSYESIYHTGQWSMANDDGYITCSSSTLHREKTLDEWRCVLPFYLPFYELYWGESSCKKPLRSRCAGYFSAV